MARAAVRALLANRMGLQIGRPASLEAQAFVTPDVLLCPFRIERIGIFPNLTLIERDVNVEVESLDRSLLLREQAE
jgi:hypothetical protein